jgi:hypothetical protein
MGGIGRSGEFRGLQILISIAKAFLPVLNIAAATGRVVAGVVECRLSSYLPAKESKLRCDFADAVPYGPITTFLDFDIASK